MRVIKWAMYSYYKVGVDLVPDWFSERRRMVDTQLRRRGIRDERVLAAMLKIPREEFVPLESRLVAYQDGPTPIGEGQTISQPYMTALMAESLELGGGERVLEVGAGCGYAAAVLGALAAHVITIEIIPSLARQARENLRRTARDGNVRVVETDGSAGYRDAAPYDAISVAAGAPAIPAALIEQLNDPGILVIPVGALDDQELRVVTVRGGKVDSRVPTLCRFVPLRGGEGWR
jgi:protein-L-isoaspartate(D-aspartate) O-methyltransferase